MMGSRGRRVRKGWLTEQAESRRSLREAVVRYVALRGAPTGTHIESITATTRTGVTVDVTLTLTLSPTQEPPL